MTANLAALDVLAELARDGRGATPLEQQKPARWSSWGAVREIFDDTRAEWAPERARLRELLDHGADAAARRTTINAHHTDPAYVREIWRALNRRVAQPLHGGDH